MKMVMMMVMKCTRFWKSQKSCFHRCPFEATLTEHQLMSTRTSQLSWIAPPGNSFSEIGMIYCQVWSTKAEKPRKIENWFHFKLNLSINYRPKCIYILDGSNYYNDVGSYSVVSLSIGFWIKMGMKLVTCLVVFLAIFTFELNGQRNRNNNRNNRRNNNRNNNNKEKGENKKQPQLLSPPVPEKCSSSNQNHIVWFFLYQIFL